LEVLDMAPIVAIAETETWLYLTTSKDPETELRMFRTRNRHVTGIAMTLYAANERFARTVVAQTLRALELKGVRVDRRGVGCTVEALQAMVFEISAGLGVRVLTSGERLQMAIAKVESQARLAAGKAGER
jgi:hypothetical protein